MTTPPTQKFRIALLATATLVASLFYSASSHAALETEALPTLKGLSVADEGSSPAGTMPSLRDRIVKMSMNTLGTLYHWGGDDPDEGFDCSGLVRFVFHKTAGLNLPRTSREQHSSGQSVGRQQLLPGDLVFFKTGRTRIVRVQGHHKSLRTVISSAVSHVGIYIGDNQFIHAPVRGERVRIDNLDASYWTQHYAGASRYLTPQAVAQALATPVDASDDFSDDSSDAGQTESTVQP